jgi:putative ABC transport system ATP-binding protein
MLQQWWERMRGRQRPDNGGYRHGNTHLLELHSVVKNYITPAGEFPALKEIDLCVDRGEFCAVLGKSGSGKSTLMNMITGIDRPSSGHIFVGDTAVHTLSEGRMTVWRGRNVGIIFQSFQLLPTLTVIENVMMPMDVCHTYPVRQFRQRALELLDQVEMARHADKLPSAISGGEQQRVAIARALANDPPLIMADEPTGSLDTRTADVVIRIFERLMDEGKTMLMVTHDKDLAQRAARQIYLVDGDIVDADTFARQGNTEDAAQPAAAGTREETRT